jgi:HlyD family secretion protein
MTRPPTSGFGGIRARCCLSLHMRPRSTTEQPGCRRRMRLAGAAIALALSACVRESTPRMPGYVEAEFVYVAPLLAGRLDKLAVRRGDRVASAAPLFELERESEAAARSGSSERLQKARATLARTEADFQRAEKLFAGRVISPEEHDRARTLWREAEAEAAAADAALKQAQWQFDQKSVASPAAGLVHDTLYREGEWVGAGKPVVILLPPENLKIRFFLGEAQLASIRHGMRLRVLPDGAAPIQAPVTYVSPKAEFTPPVIFSREQRGKLVFLVELSVPPEDAERLHPGLPVDVEVPGISRTPAD